MRRTQVGKWTSGCLVFAMGAALAMLGRESSAAVSQEGNASADAQSPDISGTWIAKRTSPMGEMEIVYKLKVTNGKITGSQGLPFGDSPITDGEVSGDSFHFTVELESFGDIQKREVTGKIVGDTLDVDAGISCASAGRWRPLQMAHLLREDPLAVRQNRTTHLSRGEERRLPPIVRLRSTMLRCQRWNCRRFKMSHTTASPRLRQWGGTAGINSAQRSTTRLFAGLRTLQRRPECARRDISTSSLTMAGKTNVTPADCYP